MFVFRKIWRALFSCNTRFEIRPFPLLSTKCLYVRDLKEVLAGFIQEILMPGRRHKKFNFLIEF